jgi:hypothetical protein
MGVDGAALEDDAASREILPRLGGSRSVVLVVEDGRHVASVRGDFSEVNGVSARKAERPEGAGQAQDDPSSAQRPYLPAIFFFFT